MTERPECPLYVGDLQAPRRHRRFLRWSVPALLVGAAALAAGIAAAQRSPGRGVWDTGRLREWTGALVVDPYPILLVDKGARAMLIVEVGKRGARERLAPHAKQRVRLQGWLLERTGRRMIELIPDDDAVEPLGSEFSQTPMRHLPGAAVTLAGEILDSKCHLGAMKPGDGKAHKACATLCVQGGIPPLLLARDEVGALRRYLLVDAAGGAANEETLPFLGEPVEVRGRLGRIGDLSVLTITTGGVRRR